VGVVTLDAPELFELAAPVDLLVLALDVDDFAEFDVVVDALAGDDVDFEDVDLAVAINEDLLYYVSTTWCARLYASPRPVSQRSVHHASQKFYYCFLMRCLP
jgi:hypothetical protein